MNKCLLCHASLVHEFNPIEIFATKRLQLEMICPRCLHEFEFISAKQHCPTCWHAGFTSQCPDCQYWQTQGYDGFQHQALFSYNAAMHDYFKRYKRYGDYHLRQVFQQYLRSKLRTLSAPFIYVPTQASHWHQRGFDPVVGIFGSLVTLTPALVKLETFQAQAQKNRQQRLLTPQFFRFNEHYQNMLQAPQITILDDIYTTGRTIFHAHNCLRQNGYHGIIRSFSLAR